MFPTNILAGIMKMTHKNVFEIPKIEREKINVGEMFEN